MHVETALANAPDKPETTATAAFDLVTGDRLDQEGKECVLLRGKENWLSQFSSCPTESMEATIRQEVRALFARWLRMENVCLLVGAGASHYVTEFVTSGLYGAATKLLKGRATDATLQLLLKYCSEPDGIGTQFESFLSQLAAWRSLTDASRWPLEKLIPTLPPLVAASGASGQEGGNRPGVSRDDIVALLADLERAIAVACNVVLPESTLCQPESTECKWDTTPHEALFAKLVARDPLLGRAKVFTINYDTLIEQALDRLGILYCDGFVGTVSRQFNPAAYDLDFYYPDQATEGKVRRYDKVVHLYKLHGSTNWRQSSRSPATNPYGITFDGAPLPAAADIAADASGKLLDSVFGGDAGLAILPTASKYGESLAMPYAHMFRAFYAALQSPQTVLMVLGYGGWDEHVNRLIEDALSNPSFTCVIVGPTPEAWARRVCRADACGRVFYMGGEWAKFEHFALEVLPDLETLRTEIEVAHTMRDLQKRRATDAAGTKAT